MGFRSVVSGYITISDWLSMGQTKETIASYPFDEAWPFTNIFWCDSSARYHGGVVAFAGSYKQVEEVWSEWLWKFSQLLTKLEAEDARVTLDCVLGVLSWRLLPKPWGTWRKWNKEHIANPTNSSSRPPIPASMIGQPWGIVEAPDDDFSINPEWLAQTEQNMKRWDEATGTVTPYKWDHFVERWL